MLLPSGLHPNVIPYGKQVKMLPSSSSQNKQENEHGNVLLMVLLAIVLIGALTVAIQGTSQQSNHIDDETLLFRITETQRYTAELERGIAFIIQNGHSEADIRFAHPNAHTDYGDLSSDTDKSDQMFDREGGGARYNTAPDNINDGSAWEFYGHTALAHAGSDEAELIAVLPNVTQAFCEKINEKIGYSTTMPQDDGTCLNSGASFRFDDTTQFSSSPNTTNEATFSFKPSLRGCAQCADGSYHYFHVLLSR